MSDERANSDSQPEVPESDQTAEGIAAFAAELSAKVPRSDGGRPAAGAPPAAGKPPVATRLSYNVLLLILAVAAITALVALSYSASFRSPAAVTADSATVPHPQRPGFLDTPPRSSGTDSVRSLRDTGWARESLAVVGEENRLADRTASRGARFAKYGSYDPNADRERRARAHEDATYEKALTAHALITSRDERQPSEQTASTSIERDSMSFPGVPEFERRSGDFAGGGQLLPQPVGGGNAASRVAMTSGDPSRERRHEADSFLRAQRVDAEASDEHWGEVGNAVLVEGTVIPAELLTDVNSDLPGEIVGEVTRDVFDSPTQRIVLIPKGSRLAGKYDDAVALGQSRLLVAWTRLLLPDGRDVRLPGLESADERGASGVTGSVDSHIGQQFGDALLLSLLGAGVELSQPSGGSGAFGAPSVGQAAGAALGQQLSEVALELVRRHADVPPTISLPLGSRFNVYLNRDLVLPPRARPGDPSA